MENIESLQIVMARKPLTGTVADNVTAWGVGGINVDGCRIETTDDLSGGSYGGIFSGTRDEFGNLKKAIGSGDKGRWPANVILDSIAGAALDAQSGWSGSSWRKQKHPNKIDSKGIYGEYNAQPGKAGGHSDSGGASRFFYNTDTAEPIIERTNMHYTLLHGDNREQLKHLADNSIDSIVCDPPYELGFMGKRWDSTGIAYDLTVWTECLRVLKPGGHLIAFGGTRTYHRMTVAIEDAGFEIRDCIMWLYGSGFPKSHNLQGDWKGWGTALKPAVEPAVLARKPLIGTVADNVTAWGVGGINVDGCRVGLSDGESAPSGSGKRDGVGGVSYNLKDWIAPNGGNGGNTTPASGRWLANVILDEDAGEALDEQSGVRHGGGHARHSNKRESFSLGKYNPATTHGHSDSGGASRFFYTAKASKAEREAGLEGMEEKLKKIYSDMEQGALPQQTPRESQPRANHHPTVKPIALMRYLVRLVTPKDGTVLDPFMGSGSTGCAAMCEGMNFVGIELSEEYLEIARRRIEYWQSQNPMGL